MLSRRLLIQEFIARDLHGLAGPDCVQVERRQTADGSTEADDPAHSVVTLTIAGRKYGLSVKASSVAPPLGEILFTDRQTGDMIRGEVRDLVWKEIADHIRAAGKVTVAAPAEPVVLPLAPPAVEMPADGRRPFIGLPVVFTPHPSEARGGVTEMAALVSKVHPDGTVGLTLLPFFGEPMWRDRVPRRRTDKDSACWDFQPDSDLAAARAEIAELRQMVEDLTAPTPKTKAKG